MAGQSLAEVLHYAFWGRGVLGLDRIGAQDAAVLHDLMGSVYHAASGAGQLFRTHKQTHYAFPAASAAMLGTQAVSQSADELRSAMASAILYARMLTDPERSVGGEDPTWALQCAVLLQSVFDAYEETTAHPDARIVAAASGTAAVVRKLVGHKAGGRPPRWVVAVAPTA